MSLSCELNPPLLAVDPERFYRSGEKGKGCIAREYYSRDKGYSLVPRLPGPALGREASRYAGRDLTD
jgi:hypothetical protein